MKHKINIKIEALQETSNFNFLLCKYALFEIWDRYSKERKRVYIKIKVFFLHFSSEEV